ncbi:hypothetical protein KAH81_04300 [bacterium]|nr:hypothetical protein [bacterium]
MGAGLGAGLIVLIVALVLIELVLKGIALWKSARIGQTGWFVCLLIFNTAGLLPLIYLLAVAKPIEKRLSRE